MIERDSFVFYKSFYAALSKIRDVESRLRLYEMITRYSLFGDEVQPETDFEEALWECIKPQIEANQRRWENSKKGGAPKGNANARKTTENNQKQPKTTEVQPNVNVNDNVNANVNVNVNAEAVDVVADDELKFERIVFTDLAWVERVAMYYHKTPDQIGVLWNRFLSSCKIREQGHSGEKDAKRHFCNWLNSTKAYANTESTIPANHRVAPVVTYVEQESTIPIDGTIQTTSGMPF